MMPSNLPAANALAPAITSKSLGLGGYFIKHLGVNPGSLQHALDCLDNAGAFQAGGYDQSIGHTQCSGIITNHCMCAPTDIYGWISVHHLDRVFKSFILKGPFYIFVVRHGYYLLFWCGFLCKLICLH